MDTCYIKILWLLLLVSSLRVTVLNFYLSILYLCESNMKRTAVINMTINNLFILKSIYQTVVWDCFQGGKNKYTYINELTKVFPKFVLNLAAL